MLLKDLLFHLNNELQSAAISDYSPNGLQVEGKSDVLKLLTGVTASEALIDEAIAKKADAILVHHGYFWKGEPANVVGMKKNRLKKLLTNDISLLAYHLPIDVHPTLGNNAQLGAILKCNNIQAMPNIQPNGIVMQGELAEAVSHAQLAEQLGASLHRAVVSVGSKSSIQRVAWCTGGGQNFIDQVYASDGNIDAFISGEISEQTTHSARELGIDFFAAGHHATERYGVKAVGEWLMKEFALNVEFVDISNPA